MLDPDCGAGTVLVEALRAGRRAVGLATNHRDRELARANLTTADHADAWPEGMVLDDTFIAQADRTDHLAGLTGKVDLLLTAPRHPVSSAAPTGPPDLNPLDTLTKTLVRCRGLLRPCGYVVVTLPPQRHHRQLLDLTRGTLAAGHTAGLLPVERYVTFLAELHGTCVITRVSLAQRRVATRHRRLTGHPSTRTAHHDVLVFRIPEGVGQVVTGLTATVAGLEVRLSLGEDPERPLGGGGLTDITHRDAASSPTPRKQAA